MNRVTHFEIYTNEERGGKICVPKMAIPKVPSLAYAEDTARNVFGIIEPNREAK
jgi:predicted enzyme related to lactoylglutathione lyase